MRRLAPVLLLLLAPPLACGPAGEPTASSPESGAASIGPGTAGQGPHGAEAGLVLVDPHHPAHPGWVDFGTLQLGEVATRTVELVNREGRALTIRNLRAGCACTTTAIGYRDAQGQWVAGDPRSQGQVLTVPEGATVELSIRIDSRQAPLKNSPKRVNVRIVTDSDTDAYTTVEAQFLVESPFLLAPERLDFGQVAENGLATAALRIVPLADVRPLAITGLPPGMQLELEEDPFQGEPAWRLTGILVPPLELGLVEHLATLSTERADGSPAPPLNVPVRVTGIPDLEVSPARLVLRLGPGGPGTAEVVVRSNLEGQRFRAHSPVVEGPGAAHLAVELLPGEGGEAGKARATRSPSWTLRLGPSGAQGEPADLVGVVRLELEGIEPATLTVPYLAVGGS